MILTGFYREYRECANFANDLYILYQTGDYQNTSRHLQLKIIDGYDGYPIFYKYSWHLIYSRSFALKLSGG